MIVDSRLDHDNNNRIIHKQAFKFSVLLFLFIAAFGIRLYNISKPPMDFSTIRQYQNAHIARGLFYETDESISEEKKQIARINMERMGFVLEPRIIENAAVLGYRLAGSEYLWIPRVLSSIFWIVGGMFLYLTARMLFQHGVALLSTIFYLFLPYSILSSRIFQSDPLMVMMMLGGIYRILKYDEKSSLPNLVIAAIVSAIAVFIKPYCIFMIFGAFFSLVVLRMGFWKALLHRNTVVFTILIIVPTIFYYAYGLFTNVGFLGEHAKGSFLPHLVFYAPFWKGWFDMIGIVIGYLAFSLAILGFIKIRERKAKTLLSGLWTGYFIFALSATFQIHTHSYYHMPFIPIVALSLGSIAAMVINRNFPLITKHTITIIAIVFCVIILGLSIGMSKLQLKNFLSDHKRELKTMAEFISVTPEFGKFLINDFEKEVRIAVEIGEIVGHSTKTVFLDPYFGRSLAYHGEFGGLPWPTSQSLYGRALRGEKVPNIKEDFTNKHIILLYQGKFITYTPDYFIVTAFDEFNKQKDLKDYLNWNFPLLTQSDDYLIYDLRKMSK